MSGGGGSGLESALGVIAPVALSAMFPGIGTALGGGLDALGLGSSGLGLGAGTLDAIGSGLGGAALSGGVAALTGGNPLTAALLGGVGSGVASELGSAGTAPLATDISGVSGADPTLTAASLTGADNPAPVDMSSANTIPQTSSIPTSSTSAAPVANNGSGGSGNGLGTSDFKNLAIAGGIAAPVLQSILNPLPKYNVQGTANSVMATNPSFNAALPSYSMQNTATPYSGNWYTYGLQPEQSMYNARPIATGSKTGGLIGYSHGGRVQNYAMGGGVMPPAMGAAPMPQQAMPPQNPLMAQRPPMPPQGQPQKPVNPLMLKAVHEIGVAIGKHIKNKQTPPGRVQGAGGGQDDVIPARLSDGEYVLSADIPSALGDGSSAAGARKLDKMVSSIRAHKTSHGSKFPPKAKKNPLSYIKGEI
jgi:hypothetical protein